MIIVSFKLLILDNYDAFSSAFESNRLNPRDRTLDLPLTLIFGYKRISSLKKCRLSFAQGETLPYSF